MVEFQSFLALRVLVARRFATAENIFSCRVTLITATSATSTASTPSATSAGRKKNSKLLTNINLMQWQRFSSSGNMISSICLTLIDGGFGRGRGRGRLPKVNFWL